MTSMWLLITPMGSTAYSLSNGGPIITPETDIICLTPVAPHSLNVRPIVIPDNSVVTLKVESRSHNFLIAVDGRSESLPEGTLPETDIICLTPVAPHSLNVRPIVIPDNSVVTLKVESRSHNFLIAVDGRSESLPEGTLITIRKADYTAKVVRFSDHRYFSTLREKMMWGADQR